MSKIPTLEEMLQAGVHFGHQSSRWHPKMAPHIFGERRGVHIINLEDTQTCLQAALDFMQGVASRGGVILFVGTKRQARTIVKEQAEACGMPYIIDRWLGGTFTNFDQLKQLIKRYNTLRNQQEKGELRKYTKREQLLISRKIKDLERKVGGIATLEKIPDVVFIVDLHREKTAYQESQHVGTKVVAICDTNINPSGVDYPIPANDDAVKSIQMMVKLVSDAVREGKSHPVVVQQAKTDKPKQKLPLKVPEKMTDKPAKEVEKK